MSLATDKHGPGHVYSLLTRWSARRIRPRGALIARATAGSRALFRVPLPCVRGVVVSIFLLCRQLVVPNESHHGPDLRLLWNSKPAHRASLLRMWSASDPLDRGNRHAPRGFLYHQS